MSTVPEAIVARGCGMRVTAISLITKSAAGLTKRSLAHADVLQIADTDQMGGEEHRPRRPQR